jgi:hypothetical protein
VPVCGYGEVLDGTDDDEDESGALYAEAVLPPTGWASDLLVSLQLHDVYSSSAAFVCKIPGAVSTRPLVADDYPRKVARSLCGLVSGVR